MSGIVAMFIITQIGAYAGVFLCGYWFGKRRAT